MAHSISNSAPPGGNDDPKVAAKQLEAYFLRRILAEVGPGGAYGGEGVAGSTFRGMFEEALADAVAETGQVGLAQTITASLEGEGGQRASADLTATAVWSELGADGLFDASQSSQDPEGVADAALAERLRGSATAQDEERANQPLYRGRIGTNR